MKHEQRNNRIRYHGGRPPPGASGGGRTNGTGRRHVVRRPRPRVRRACREGDRGGGSDPGAASPLPLLARAAGRLAVRGARPAARPGDRASGRRDVRLVHVHCPLESAYDPDRFYPDSGLDAWLRRRQQAYLDGLVRRLAKVTSVPVTPLFLQGREVAATLCEVAGAATDLVVMATHGRGPLGRLWHGSVADALLRRLTAPLLLVRGHDAPVDLTGDPAPRHVLIPLDGSEGAEQVLGPALDLGALTGADHTLLRVIRQEPDYSAGCGGGLDGPLRDKQQAESRADLRRVAERLGGQVPNGVARDVPAVALPEAVSPATRTSVNLSEDLKQLREQARERDHFLDLLRRTRADFENFQKRVRRERDEERRYQHGVLVIDLLSVLDDLERATAAAERAGDAGPLAQGVELVRAMFLDVLRRHGVTLVRALGQQFDPHLHHALVQETVPGPPANTVVRVVKEGYRIHERLLRPPVVVAARCLTHTRRTTS